MDKGLPFVLFAYREVPQVSIGFSPFELLYGWQVQGPLDLLRKSWQEPPERKPESVLMVRKVKDVEEKDGCWSCRKAHICGESDWPRRHKTLRVAIPTRPVPRFVSSEAWMDRINTPHHPPYQHYTISMETLPGT